MRSAAEPPVGDHLPGNRRAAGVMSPDVRSALRWSALTLVGAVCLGAAVWFIGGAIATLHSSTAGAGVDAGAGSGGGAARRYVIRVAVATSVVAVLLAGLTEALLPLPAERTGPGRRRPLGLLRGVDHRRFIGGTFGATAGYIAVCFGAGWLAGAIVPGRRPYPGSAVRDLSLLGRDLVESGAAGLTEELLLFGIPLALLGIWQSRQAQWVGLLLIIALRYGIHLYYGVGYAAVFVVPWMIGAWLLYRAIGTIWPLIIGHALYDAAQFTTLRTGHTWAYTALQITAAIGALLLVRTIDRARRSKDLPDGQARPTPSASSRSGAGMSHGYAPAQRSRTQRGESDEP